jgi:electron-transferring-flavoprotein dehydrogenase
MERVDVAIVGGGPAGTAAAWTAAEADANTLVIEKGVPRTDRNRTGPDSTDAAGLLDYWIDLMDFEPEEIPDDVILRTLDGADFMGPSESVAIDDTGIEATHPDFGVAFHRARFDDWLREEAEAAGANYHVGATVTGVDSVPGQSPQHTLELSDGETVGADALILADGPQRSVTIPTLDQFTDERTIADVLNPTTANHIAYQEHRRLPRELFDSSRIKFWWGLMPGHTAYPWVFPNDDTVARIGLTMPIGLDIETFDPTLWDLLDETDERIPQGNVYLQRLLEREFPSYDLEDFPLVEDRGKRNGTETYPISSTRPIESPTQAGVAVVGGAMGGTSAFHEGGDHVAVRTGKIAGELAATDNLEQYNQKWQAALGTEFRRNVTMAAVVREYMPSDWDRTFAAADRMLNRGEYTTWSMLKAGLSGVKLVYEYKRTKRGFTGSSYVQYKQSEYRI